MGIFIKFECSKCGKYECDHSFQERMGTKYNQGAVFIQDPPATSTIGSLRQIAKEKKEEGFTPKKEDFKLGFRFEFLSVTKWVEGLLREHSNLDFIFDKLDKGEVRVPYLNRKKIEDAGWSFKDQLGEQYVWHKNFNGSSWHEIIYDLKEHWLVIKKKNLKNPEGKVIFEGYCECINKLKTLMEWLKL